jgi:hypothetical protein
MRWKGRERGGKNKKMLRNKYMQMERAIKDLKRAKNSVLRFSR